jgi:hypothetical protein
MPSENEAIRDAHAAIVWAISELRDAGIPVPQALHRAAHSLSYALRERGECQVLPFKRGEPPR